MPKFWAKDYLSEALQEQRAMVERMSLAPPAHIEIVDCYAHKGEIEDIHYTMPWILISPDPDFNLQVHVPASLLEPVHNDLQTLMAYGGYCLGGTGDLMGGHHGGTKFANCVSGGGDSGSGVMEWVEALGAEDSGSECLFSDDDDDEEERGTSSAGLTQEIDSAVERVLSSMMSSPGTRKRGHMFGLGEEFSPEDLRGWEMNTTPEVAEHYLEEHESSSHLPSLLSALPRVADLVARLKPKLISDPLRSPTSGKPYSYMHVCRSDFEFIAEDSVHGEAPPVNKPSTTAQAADHFQREEIDANVDPVLELHVVSPLQPLLHSSPSDSLLPALPQLPSPVREEGEEGEEMQIDLKPGEELGALVSAAGEEAQRQDQQLQFSSPLPGLSGHAEFIKLNNADVSRDSEDSGIGHAILESPCLPLSLFSSPPPLPSSLPAQLARLDPMPVSPHSPHKLVLLSPVSEARLLAQLQEEGRAFDNVLALKLPYAGSDGHLEAVLKSYKPLCILEESCDIRPIHFTGDSELDLPWDPLASSYHAMAAVQRRLACLQCPMDAEGSGMKERSDTTETFRKDVTVKTLGEGLADAAIQMIEGGDLPSLSAAPPGYMKAGQTGDCRHVSVLRPPGATIEQKHDRVGEKRGRNERLLDFEEGMSPLDMFIMLRSGTLSPEVAKSFESGMQSKKDGVKEPELETEATGSQEDQGSWVNSPTVQDVYLNREYQVLLGKVANYGAPLVESLRAHGLHIARESFNSLDPDDVKFFLKQQQKRLADSQGSKEEGVLLQSCKLAACLYVLVSFANGVANINLATGIRRFTFLNEKYEKLVGRSLDLAKQSVADIQLRSRNQSMYHPKLQTMVSVVNTWRTNTRKHSREKVVVVVGKEFPTVSGDILDFLKSISELKSCVFSFACDSPTNPMYLEALEERFHYYDCLVMPVASITNTFPWEKVSLLVEYEPLGSTLFPDGQRPASLQLRQWLALKTVQDISASSLAKSGTSTHSSSVLSFQHTLIASENVTANTKLLQLLESRFNMLLISREYENLKKKMGSSLSYADLIVDQTTGIIVHPLSLLSSDPGVHTVSTRAAALSLQFERLWILLHAESESSYAYGGSVPLNLARLHASVAHYCPRQDAYQVKIICASGCEEVAQLVRSITEETRRQTEGVNEQLWSDREWIVDDLETHEKFLLSFPCLNSFSALLMLRVCSLGQILALDALQLQELFPWLPLKVLKFFNRLCHISFQQSLPALPSQPSHEVGEYWENSSNVQYYAEAPTITLDDSLQYASDDGNTPFSALHERDHHLPHNLPYQAEEMLPSLEGMAAPLSSEDDADLMGITSYPSNAHADTMADATQEEESGFQFFHPSNNPLVQQKESGVLNGTTDSPTRRAWSVTNTAVASTFTSDTSSVSTYTFPPFERNATLRVPFQNEVRSSVLSKISSTSNHNSMTDNIAREYYGSDPMPPRLLTSGMVRRTPGRQPIKSLDLDRGTSKGPQPRLQSNDRAAVMCSDRRCKGGGRSSLPESFPRVSTSDCTRQRRMPGMEDLMAFHSRQSVVERGRERGVLTSNVAIRASTIPPLGSRIQRPKRPLSCSPVFDCQVPTHIVSPRNDGESSLYSSPNISLGSFQLSPVRKRRLVYKRLPSSSDGQTKLAFE